jgi:hypothetical protein
VGLSPPRKKDLDLDSWNYNVGVDSDSWEILCGGQGPISTMKKNLKPANDLGSAKIPVITADTPTPDLPAYLYVTASLAKSNNRIVIAQWTVISFMVLGLGIYIWCLAWLSWAMTIQGPNISQFPIMDFASRIVSGGMAEDSLVPILAPLTNASAFRRNLEGVRIFLGDIWPRGGSSEDNGPRVPGLGAPRGKIGFSTESAARQRLRKGVIYE